jgi:hypothetical protein
MVAGVGLVDVRKGFGTVQAMDHTETHCYTSPPHIACPSHDPLGGAADDASPQMGELSGRER